MTDMTAGSYHELLIAQGKLPCVCCGIPASEEDGGNGRYCHICIARGHHEDGEDDYAPIGFKPPNRNADAIP